MPSARSVYSIALLASVFAALCLPLVGLRQDPVSLRENRGLAQRPVWSGQWTRLPDLAEDWEAYFNDQYGFRNEAIRLSEGLWERLGLSAPPAVIRGREDWLFLGKGEEISPLRDFAGVNLWTEAELEEWRERLQARHDGLRARGIAYVFFIAPNKMEIYGEYLPAKYRRRDGPSRCEQLVDYLSRHSTVPVIYARSAMQELEGPDNPLLGYFKSGTHWNAYGAGLAQNALGDWLARRFQAIEPAPYRAQDFELRAAGVDVDLARMLGIEGRYSELAPMLKRPLPAFERRVVAATELGLGSALQVEAWRFDNDRPLCFLAFGDSFFENLAPYLGNYFGEGRVVSAMPSDWQLEAAVDAYPAEVVIEQRVERFLGWLPEAE